MGEIAEMMLDGMLCQCCGDFLGTDNGYPTYCADCAPEEEKKKPKISAAERKIRKRALDIIRQNFDFDMQENHRWEDFLPTRFMDYIREARNSEDFKKVVIKSVTEWAEINELIKKV